ncbi:MAG: hypothetical protein JXB04_02930 [Kiritimatiellae bacterium]|nr:hypothetical protein [Kiritimatiellia bacterium]
MIDNGNQPRNRSTPLWLPEGTNYFENITIRGMGQVTEVISSPEILRPSNVAVCAGATLTHPITTTNEEFSLLLLVSGTLTVDSDGSIDVGGRGYRRGYTLGNTTVGASTLRSGGSHGGLGAEYSGEANATYGDFRNPNEPGSGGGSEGTSGAGGGLVRITANELILDGLIQARGSNSNYSAGSGGGIYLDVAKLSGSGAIHADGGGCNDATGSGGGGGRIAVYCGALDGFDLAGEVTATGGLVYTGNNGENGTVFTTNRVAPVMVWSVSPSGDLAGVVTEIRIEFSTPLDESTLTLEDLTLIGPGDEAIELASLTRLSMFDFQVGLTNAISTPGIYTFSMGTNVLTFLGGQRDEPYSNYFRIAGPPESFVLASPASGAVYVATATSLNWSDSLGADYYEVYLGTDPYPAYYGSNTASTLSVSGLENDRQYYWYVVATNSYGSYRAPETGTWSFRTIWYCDTQITVNITIHTNNNSYDGKSIIVNAATAVVNGVHSFSNLYLINGAVLTHSNTTISIEYRLDLCVSNTLLVSSDSSINAKGKGYQSGRTVGNTTQGASASRSGGSYGGLGGRYDGIYRVNDVYDDWRSPAHPGSSGGSASGGAGGGLLWIDAGALVLDGTIDVSGNDGSCGNGAGSGGGVRLQVGTLTGGGSIGANGGNAGTSGYCGGGAGGGGRIAIYYTDAHAFDLEDGVRALGGIGQEHGSAGTVYLREGEQVGKLIVDSQDIARNRGTPIWLPSGSNYFEEIIVRGTGELAELWSDTVMPTNLTIGSGATLSQQATTTTQEHQLVLTVPGTVTVETNAQINVHAKGYLRGRTESNQVLSSIHNHAGGSHGGTGGVSGSSTPIPVYGSALHPSLPGGGSGAGGSFGGAGGGLVRLTAGTLTLDGAIVANGENAGGANAGGAGAGGGIFVDAGSLSGGGSVSAIGGAGLYCSGRGGGGRIAIYYGNGTGSCTNNLSAAGGSGSAAGSPGTIHLGSGVASVVVLSADPAGHVRSSVTQIDLTFYTPIQDESLTVGDISLKGPGANPITIAGLARFNPYEYNIALTNDLTEEGVYTLTMSETHVRTILGGTLQETYTNIFIIDTTPPNPPIVTNYAAQPVTNAVPSTGITLRGTREDNTAVWVGGVQRVVNGSGPWACSQTLAQGFNTVSLTAMDLAGNESVATTYWFYVDTVAPTVTSVNPLSGVFLPEDPETVTLTFNETGSGLDLADSSLRVTRAPGVTVLGDWGETVDTLTFTPQYTFVDGVYSVTARLADVAGNFGSTFSSSFTLDRAPPAAPVVDPVQTPTVNLHQWVTGTREAYAEIWMNGAMVVAGSASTAWSHEVTLGEGTNVLGFCAVDRAGNAGPTTTVQIIYDNAAPGPVSLTGNGAGIGTTVLLDWTSYIESTNGADIASYTIYEGPAGWSCTSDVGVEAIGMTPAGSQTYVVTGLVRDTTYYFGVIAKDITDLALSCVTGAAAVTTVDIQPPTGPFNMQFDCFESNLVARWSPSTASDLAGYRMYFEYDAVGENLGANVTNYTRDGLNRASGYHFEIKPYDASGNTNTGIAAIGYTLLDNPTNVVVDPYDSIATLTWSTAAPTQYVKHYLVYHATNDFTDITGMQASVTVTGTTTAVAGLQNLIDHYFAVVTVNLSGGRHTNVTTVTAMPTPDTNGPTVTALTFAGADLTNGIVVGGAGTVAVTAQDPAGVHMAAFHVNGMLAHQDVKGSDGYSYYWNMDVLPADGTNVLAVSVYDALGNATTVSNEVVLVLAAPAQAPQITMPADNAVTNRAALQVRGRGRPYTEVTISIDGSPAAQGIAVDPVTSNFVATLSLHEGTNELTAVAQNRAGTSPASTAIRVALDTSVPPAPMRLEAASQPAGAIRLDWQAPEGAAVKGYNIYRSTAEFSGTAGVTRVNPALITADYRIDTPMSGDGVYYYRVGAVNFAGTEGALSELISALSDSAGPAAVEIACAALGRYDPVGERYGAGAVEVSVTLSEPASMTPFLSMTPKNGVPIAITLARVNDLLYSGQFVIEPTTPAGTATMVFSARDAVGNRSADIGTGATLVIDTAGPVCTNLIAMPSDPIQNSQASPVTVSLVFEFDEPMATNVTPEFEYQLSSAQGTWIGIPAVVSLDPLPSSRWQADFTLPADAGSPAEYLEIRYDGEDDLENLGATINAPHEFEVYQGDLPSLGVPGGLTAKSRPGGDIQVWWNAVPEAIGYRLYREGPAGGGLVEYVSPVGTNYWDEPMAEGEYSYAVASIRSENGQMAVSDPSDPVSAMSDAVAPSAPTNLTLALLGNGILATWLDPSNTLDYSLYRSTGAVITTVADLQPIKTGIPQMTAVDPSPNKNMHAYTVTAVDEAGNESDPAESAYLNFLLLPVHSLSVVFTNGSWPNLAWSHKYPSDLVGYNVFVGPDDALIQIHTGIVTQTSFADFSYNGLERRYSIKAVDTNSVASTNRAILLPDMQSELVAGVPFKRGMMNRLTYVVTNSSDQSMQAVQLVASVGSLTATSQSFQVAGHDREPVTMVLGGDTNLSSQADLWTRMEMTPEVGSLVTIVDSMQVPVVDDRLGLDMLNIEFVRGGLGTNQWILRNTGTEEIEIVTATGGGEDPSPDVRVKLLDADGNVLSQVSYEEVGGRAHRISTGEDVVRIQPGEEFVSEPIELFVPSDSPRQVRLVLEIDDVYYHRGRTDETRINGLGSRRAITLVDTPYFAVVTNVTPSFSLGNENILITGRCLDRASQLPVGGAKLNLAIAVQGFERVIPLVAGADGSFTYAFVPSDGESGLYRVWALHPLLADKTPQAEFVIRRVMAKPNHIELDLPMDRPLYPINIEVETGVGTTVSNLTLQYVAGDQPGGQLPACLIIEEPTNSIAVLGPKAKGTLTFRIQGQTGVERTGTLYLRLVSSETPDSYWELVRLDYRFAAAQPYLRYDPTYVETGIARGRQVKERITLRNNGLAVMENVCLRLEDARGEAVPPWLWLEVAADQGNIAVGEERHVDITIAPYASMPEGDYTYYLKVDAHNHEIIRRIPLYVAVADSGIGHALFKITDIYSGTVGADGQVVQGLKGAQVWIQNELVTSIESNVLTDAYGEAYFANLSAGLYRYRITADRHNSVAGRFWVRPGVTVAEDVFMDYQIVSVEWQVVPVTIEDRYEIVLHAVYQTDVPAPVLMVEPEMFELPAMIEGDVFLGEIKLKNAGLIEARNLVFKLPETEEFYKYEYLVQRFPTRLAARGEYVLPFRITCLKTPDPTKDCYYMGFGTVAWDFLTALGKNVHDQSDIIWSRVMDDCKSDVSALDGLLDKLKEEGGDEFGLDDFGGGGGTLVGNSGCWSCPLRDCECCCDSGGPETFPLGVGGEVDLRTRSYLERNVDLEIGDLRVERRYDGRDWIWGWIVGSDDDLRVLFTAKEGTKLEPELPVYHAGRLVSAGFDAPGPRFVFEEDAEKDIPRRLRAILDAQSNTLVTIRYLGAGPVTRVADFTGRDVFYGYTNQVFGGKLAEMLGAKGRMLVSSVLDPNKARASYCYDNFGFISGKTDADGREFSFGRDRDGHLASVLSGGKGYYFNFEYAAERKEYRAQITSTEGMSQDRWYRRDGTAKRIDINGRTVHSVWREETEDLVTDEFGNLTTVFYDENRKVAELIYPDASDALLTYERMDMRLTGVKDRSGIEWAYGYDGQGRLTNAARLAAGAVVDECAFAYDGDGRIAGASRRAATATSDVAFTYTNGRLDSFSDAEGHEIQYLACDALGRPTRIRDPRGLEWSYGYNGHGQIVAVTSPAGQVVSYDYDALGNVKSYIDPAGNLTTFDHGRGAVLLCRTNALGQSLELTGNLTESPGRLIDECGKNVWNAEYDGLGRVTSLACAGTGDVVVTYDAFSRLWRDPARIDYPTYLERHTYDSLRRLQSIQVEGAGTQYSFTLARSPLGSMTSLTGPDGLIAAYGYDALGRLAAVTNAAGGATLFGLDACDRLASVTGARGGTTRLAYDGNDRRVSVEDAAGHVSSNVYDGVGNLIEARDAEENRTVYRYNAFNQVTQRLDYAGAELVGWTGFTYDEAGRMSGYSVFGGPAAAYEYDRAGRLTNEVTFYGPMALTNSYDYYANGLPKSRVDSTGARCEYYYDGQNRLSSIVIPGYGQVTWNDYAWSLPVLPELEEAGPLFGKFGPAGEPWRDRLPWRYRPDVLATGGSADLIFGTPASQAGAAFSFPTVASMADHTAPRPLAMTLPGGSTIMYDYDAFGRAARIRALDPAGHDLFRQEYEYSGMGRVVRRNTEHGNYAFEYDALGCLATVLSPVLPDESYAYDTAGNRLTGMRDGASVYYDVNDLNQYLSATSAASNVYFTYDDNGSLIEAASATETNRYVYGPQNQLLWVEDAGGTIVVSNYYDPFGRRLWKDVNGVRTFYHYALGRLAGEYNESGVALKAYGYAPPAVGSSAPLFQRAGGAYYWYLNDKDATPYRLIRTSGSTAWAALYDGFGRSTATVDEVENALAFRGWYRDEETGLLYDGTRFYDPGLGRYLTRSADPLAANPYLPAPGAECRVLAQAAEDIPTTGTTAPGLGTFSTAPLSFGDWAMAHCWSDSLPDPFETIHGRPAWDLCLGHANGSCRDGEARGAVCAQVEIEIRQEMTFERQGFEATMRIINGLPETDIENVYVEVLFTDTNGAPVLATSDTNETEALFFIRVDEMNDITGIASNGVVKAGDTGEIKWLIIPAPGAGGENPKGILYYVGAKLTYRMGGEYFETDVKPDHIFVEPMPLLWLDYFLTEDVHSDDPFTERIEPPVPFSLGLRAMNTGYGVARNAAIDSAQPVITDNKQGLLVNFEITGSEVNGEPATRSLKVNLGDIPPARAAIARWIMECTLSGTFIDFSADVSHAGELGGDLTSLIETAKVHMLVHEVRVDEAGKDGLDDFLAYEKGLDPLTVYESEGIDTSVTNLTDEAVLDGTNQMYTLSVPMAPGALYAKVPYPRAAESNELEDYAIDWMEIKSVVRWDGKQLAPQNRWISKYREDWKKPWKYWINIFDANGGGDYVITTGPKPRPPNTAPILAFIGPQVTFEGESLSFGLVFDDIDDDELVITASNLPPDAAFQQWPSNTASFAWAVPTNAWGVYFVTFNVSDGELSDEEQVTIYVGHSTNESMTGSGVPSSLARYGQPPDKPRDLGVLSGPTNLHLFWTDSTDRVFDVTGYYVYFGTNDPVFVNTNFYDQVGLEPATSYTFHVRAVDSENLKSSAVGGKGVTWLPNPTNITALPFHHEVDLTWQAVTPTQYVDYYVVYSSSSLFTNALDAASNGATRGASYTVQGLVNSNDYYFAVATVNISGGMDPAVTSVWARPVQDTEPPVLESFRMGAIEITNDVILPYVDELIVEASDRQGIAEVVVSIDGAVVVTDTNGSGTTTYLWDLDAETNGHRELVLEITDRQTNTMYRTNSVYVMLAPPQTAPSITSPPHRMITNDQYVTVQGEAPKYADVVVYHNGAAIPLSVDEQWRFAFGTSLSSGTNTFTAVATNRAGMGPVSAAVIVTYDTALPAAPIDVTAESVGDGYILVTWDQSGFESIRGFNVYRATNSIATPADGMRVVTNSTMHRIEDYPATEGQYYYRVTMVSLSGNESPLSAEVSAVADRTAPCATSIVAVTQGVYDPPTQRMGPGRVDVTVYVSEELESTPFLTLTPEGGYPISVQLNEITETRYEGWFQIQQTTPSGLGSFVFSCRDLSGNRGTLIEQGDTINIDTDGPDVTELIVNPPAPIENDVNDPEHVSVVMVLCDVVEYGEKPSVSYRLSGHTNDVYSVLAGAIRQIDQLTWAFDFVLPPDAGQADTEVMSFTVSAVDDMGNAGTRIRTKNAFQVYQGYLPEPESPYDLVAESLPGGAIELSWGRIDEATDYELYRTATQGGDLAPIARSTNELSLVDLPAFDGTYWYAVASILEHNHQQSTGTFSEVEDAVSDRVPPGVPSNLVVRLVGNGMLLQWSASADASYYRPYRTATEPLDVSSNVPLADEWYTTNWIDPSPSKDEIWYTVTAVDSIGNESGPAEAVATNYTLLPVNSLQVVVTNDNPPVVSWTHKYEAEVLGYYFYIGTEGSRYDQWGEPRRDRVYVDSNYRGGERTYAVETVDDYGSRAPLREVLLPVMQASFAEGQSLKRGIINRLGFVVTNAGATAIQNVNLRVSAGAITNISSTFSVPAHASTNVSVVLGLSATLPDMMTLRTAIEVRPSEGDLVRIIRETPDLPVTDDRIVAGVICEELRRGGVGEVRWTVYNHTAVEIQLVTATDGKVSPDVRFKLLDEDGNVLSSAPFIQDLNGVKSLVNQDMVAVIPPGGTWTSEPTDLEAPTNAPENATVRLEIDRVYYHRGQADETQVEGSIFNEDVTLVEIPYFGRIVEISPRTAVASNAQNIVISGEAVSRATQLPVTTPVPLKLTISLQGFERTYDITTAADGSFSYTFKPQAGESGLYYVWAVHPDDLTEPVPETFTISRVFLDCASVNLTLPQGFEHVVNVRARVSEGTIVSNLQFRYDAADQPGGVYPSNLISIVLGDPIPALNYGDPRTLTFTVRASNTVASGVVHLKLVSGSAGEEPWMDVPVYFAIKQAEPALRWSPNYVEAGVNPGGSMVTETFELRNVGVGACRNMFMGLIEDDSSPMPSWISLASAAAQPDLPIGEEREIAINLYPGTNVAVGLYDFYVRITSSNHPPVQVPVYVSVTSSNTGNALFKLTDMYTGTIDQNTGKPIPGVAGVKVRIQHEQVYSIDQELTSDAQGEAMFRDLPVGRYVYRISSERHEMKSGTFEVRPGVTTTETVALKNNLVTVEWSIREITIEDRYDITLTVKFETDVPGAVLVFEPAQIELPEMKAGDVFNGELKIVNHGLVRADDIEYRLPENNSFFKYEMLAAIPETLNAKSSVTIPYRVTCLSEPSMTSILGSGGFCMPMIIDIWLGYYYTCENGHTYVDNITLPMVHMLCQGGMSVAGDIMGGVAFGLGGPGAAGLGGWSLAAFKKLLDGGSPCMCDTDGDRLPDSYYLYDLDNDGENDWCPKVEFLVQQDENPPEVMDVMPACEPYPVVTLGEIEPADVVINTNGTISVTLTGTVNDAIADVRDGDYDIEYVRFRVDGAGISGSDFLLTRDPAYQAIHSSLFRPFAYQSSFEQTITYYPLPGVNRIVVETSENAIGNTGHDAFDLYVGAYFTGTTTEPSKKGKLGDYVLDIDWGDSYAEEGTDMAGTGVLYRCLMRVPVPPSAVHTNVTNLVFNIDGEDFHPVKIGTNYFLGQSPPSSFIFSSRTPSLARPNVRSDSIVWVMMASGEHAGSHHRLKILPGYMELGDTTTVTLSCPGFEFGTHDTFTISGLVVNNIQVVGGVLSGEVSVPDDPLYLGKKTIEVAFASGRPTKLYDVFEVRRPFVQILLGAVESLKSSGYVDVFVPSRYGGALIFESRAGRGRFNRVWYSLTGGGSWSLLGLVKNGRYDIPTGTPPGWYRLAIAAQDLEYCIRFEAKPRIPDPDDPDDDWRPWDLSWYPMCRDIGGLGEHLYDIPGPLIKYDRAVGQMSTAEYNNLLDDHNGMPSDGAFRRQYRSWMVADGNPADYKKYGERFEVHVLDEKNAETTVGWDFDDADGDGNPWNRIGWDAAVEHDIMNDSGSRTPDGDSDDKDEPRPSDKNRWWYGHCDAESAVLATYKKPPTHGATYSWGSGTPQTFSPEDKLGLLVAAFTWSYNVIEATASLANPGDWHDIVARNLHDGKSVVVDVFRGPDAVWNTPVYGLRYELQQSNPADRSEVVVVTEVATTLGAYRYKYKIHYNTGGDVVSGGDWYAWPLDPSVDANHQQPDTAWLPGRPTSVAGHWEGKLSLDRVREILEEGEGGSWLW